jgi:AraC-like DNA-binding protein
VAATGARYLRFPPEAGERAYVEHLWMVEAPGAEAPRREILIPNGRPTVVVSLGAPGVRHDPLTGASHSNRDMLFGITTRPVVLEQRGPSSYAGAQLTPWGLAALLPGARLVDEILPLERWAGERDHERLRRDLAAQPFGEPRARKLAAFLRERAVPLAPATHAALETAVAAIDSAGGQVTVAELTARLQRSYSSVYRLFKNNLGVGPKQLCEIIRYYRFVGGLLEGANGDSVALLASLNGYYDQAHAARSFQRFTGVSASSFKRLHHGIAQLMHATGQGST